MNKQEVSAQDFVLFVQRNVEWDMRTYPPSRKSDYDTVYRQKIIFLATWCTRDWKIHSHHRNGTPDSIIDLKNMSRKMLIEAVDKLEAIINWENNTPGMRDYDRRKVFVDILIEALYRNLDMLQEVKKGASQQMGISLFTKTLIETSNEVAGRVEELIRGYTSANQKLFYPLREAAFANFFRVVSALEMNMNDTVYLLGGNQHEEIEAHSEFSYPRLVRDTIKSPITYEEWTRYVQGKAAEVEAAVSDYTDVGAEFHEELTRAYLTYSPERLRIMYE